MPWPSRVRTTDALGAAGADAVTTFAGTPNAEDVAAAMVAWSGTAPPLGAPRPEHGVRARGARVAWRRHSDAGLVGDAIGLEIVDDELVAAKPAFSGALLADIVCTSDVRLVSVRPGVLPLPVAARCTPPVFSWR